MRKGDCERCGKKNVWINHLDGAGLLGVVAECCADCFDARGVPLRRQFRRGGYEGPRSGYNDPGHEGLVRLYNDLRALR